MVINAPFSLNTSVQFSQQFKLQAAQFELQ